MEEKNNIPARVAMTADAEKDLLVSVFKGNDHLLKMTRMLMFGLDVSVQDKKLIKNTFSDPQVKKAFRKKIYPIFEEDIPEIHLNSLADFWYGVEANVLGQSKETIYQSLQSKVMVKKMLEDAMSLLDNPDLKLINLSYSPSLMDELGVSLIARNLYVKAVNEGVNIIKMIVDQVQEPEAVRKERLTKNSSK